MTAETKPPFDVRAYNRAAWDRAVARGNTWTLPVGPDVIAAARRGDWSVVLTPEKPVPREWFGDVVGKDVLCLASGGGQQGPVLAAAGARVTVLDNSPAQLAQDRAVAEREGLALTLVEGDMRHFPQLPDAGFDLVFHPCSNGFVDDVLPVWREAFRVLRPGGVLLAGFTNPVHYLFDAELEETQGVFQLRHTQPYSDLTSLTDAERSRYTEKGEPLCFGHSLTTQLGGQLEAGFLLTGLFEDTWAKDPKARHYPPFIATRALKPAAATRQG